jgi:hypothetical protein
MELSGSDHRRFFELVAATMLVAAGLLVTTAPSSAEPELHHVKYTVTAEQPLYAEIHYRDTDPPTFADYSHNPYQYSPNVEVDVGPATPWVLEVMLGDPNQWAMVTASSGQSPAMKNFHCELAVDGVAVVADEGAKGVLCSLRHW